MRRPGNDRGSTGDMGRQRIDPGPIEGGGAVILQLTGAIVRGVLVALLIVLPAFLLPGIDHGTREVSTVFALIGGLVVAVEYGASHPGLVEFRFAPPFNRIRYLSILFTVLALCLVVGGAPVAGPFAPLVTEIGLRIGAAMDFAFSPVRLVAAIAARGAGPEQMALVMAAAGIAYVVSLVMLAVFLLAITALDWPRGLGTFNLWTNLPTYEWSSAADAEARLRRDARVNIIFGFTLPFLIPLVVASLDGMWRIDPADDALTLVWTMTLWAFLPASLFMRGMAMARIAQLIARRRRALQPASVADFDPDAPDRPEGGLSVVPARVAARLRQMLGGAPGRRTGNSQPAPGPGE